MLSNLWKEFVVGPFKIRRKKTTYTKWRAAGLFGTFIGKYKIGTHTHIHIYIFICKKKIGRLCPLNPLTALTVLFGRPGSADQYIVYIRFD